MSYKGVAAILAAVVSFAFAAPAGAEEGTLPDELSLEANAAYLAANGAKEGVQTTATGLQYRAIREGTGALPGATSNVTVHYTGTLIDGSQFDSSRGGPPVSFPLNRVIPGWTEGLQLMREGGVAELVIPAKLGYGSQGAGGAIPPNQVLVFEVELIKTD
ncbi:MAG: hypothetical protein GC199_03405 [Alphaproteobacteria bacterium]|nr:hypothetical protein [Alphaproteobacteria bacterium]